MEPPELESPPHDRREELEGFVLPAKPITQGYVEIVLDGIVIQYAVTATVGPLQFDLVLDVSSPQVVISAKMTDMTLAYEIRWEPTDHDTEPPPWVRRAQVGALVLYSIALHTEAQIRRSLTDSKLRHPGFTRRDPRET